MSNNIKKLNKLEQKFLFEELVPIQFEELKETEEKKRLKFFLEAHKVENITPFEKVLKTKNTSKEKYFSKALYDTLNSFFINSSKEDEKIKFELLDNHKEDLLYILNFDIFNNHLNNTITAIYLRVLLENLYQTIQTIRNYRNIKSDSFGSAYFNNPLKIAIQHELNNVNYQLNPNSHFNVISIDDKDRLKVSKNILTLYQEDEKEGNLLTILNSTCNFNNFKFESELTNGEKKGVIQSFVYFNGIPCSKPEIIRSFFIKASIPYKNSNKINKTKLCNIIKNMGKTFFKDIIFDEETNKYKVGITPKYLNYKIGIKTSFIGNLIYKYDLNKEYHFLFNLNINDAIEKYTSILIELGHEEITKNKKYKSTLKKLFQHPIFPIF